jgi:hydroxyacylglutathione hydrolase
MRWLPSSLGPLCPMWGIGKMSIEIIRIPVLSDNYVWLAHDAASQQTMAVDPAVASPVLEAAAVRGWTITHIWNTHWHPDHTGGNAEIKAATGCTIIGPAAEAERIPTLDVHVRGGDQVLLGDHIADVIDVPAHTAGHIAYHFAGEKAAFVGDTLFAMGCGRLFEGTAAQMFDNMAKLAALPDETSVYCAHEYTQSNGRYALVAEPDNAAIVARMAQVDAARARGEPTVPTSIGAEKATNPFMRARSVEELAQRRAAKDAF